MNKNQKKSLLSSLKWLRRGVAAPPLAAGVAGLVKQGAAVVVNPAQLEHLAVMGGLGLAAWAVFTALIYLVEGK